ncbi:hypothetical protein ONE63_002842 [Megalurothrips usitatus]|uniref:Zinc finger protein 865 n=1 Tax=Megalurothrips usitatus TaxID=439358 RepID=A0AAV7X8Y5_9NEOP|nr:hypothetical protein ONE63_002842 [Megalurothrips usitatus]
MILLLIGLRVRKLPLARDSTDGGEDSDSGNKRKSKNAVMNNNIQGLGKGAGGKAVSLVQAENTGKGGGASGILDGDVGPAPSAPLNKCSLCSQIFPTAASLKIHSKTCAAIPPSVNSLGGQELILPDDFEDMDDMLGDESMMDAGNLSAEMPVGKCHCCGEDIDGAHENGEFSCLDCNKQFKLKSSLERHRRVIHAEGDTYACPECNARCPDKGTLARHMYTHTGLKPYECERCNIKFSRKYHLDRHVLQSGCDGNARPQYPCQVCGRMFNRKDNLREHLRAHAGQVKRKRTYTCEMCEKEFQGTTLLQIHMRTHTGEKPYACSYCPKVFPSSSAMKKHTRIHTGEKPYECKECYAKFTAKETLNRHMRTHTGNKPHSCKYCGKTFIQLSQLRAHIFHHTGENGYTCEICNKAFNRKSRLDLHVKYVHEGAKPFECTDCNKTFVRREDMARHTVLHSGLKAHKCPICDKAFAMKSSLKIHLLTHTKEPPRSCDECGRAFIRQDCLLRHMRTKHRDMLEEILAEAERKKLQNQLLVAATENSEGGETTTRTIQIPAKHVLEDGALADSVRELLTLLVDEATLRAFGWPDAPVDQLLEAVIRRCGHPPAGSDHMPYSDRLRHNAKLLFTVVIDDTAVKTLLNNQTVDEVILHVLRLAKS